MNAERWQKVKSLFNQAVELPVADRQKFLSEICPDESDICLEIEKMLVFADDENDSFEKNPFDVINESRALPERIGAYRIVREIGRGGMGVVYEAVRETKDFKQKVALKVIKRGMDTDAILSRFRHEQQILSSLEHPSIARFLDGGMTDDGLAFYAMEYIEGEFIDDYCRKKDLSLNERLQIFRQVCAAVQYAHQNLVIHRDLKPGNILITNDGLPKLLDFGISKILESDISENSGTATALGMMTPAYASPEQIRGERVNTATDIYSLGVILFEILTDHKPYKINSTNPYEIQKIICESEPFRPSSVAGRQWRESVNAGQSAKIENATSEKEIQKTAPKRQTTAAHSVSRIPHSALRGDLDNILLKALRKNPAERYVSVGQFSEDIRRHLEGLPITARAATFAYRVRKFIGRNRIPVAAAVIVFVSLCAGIGVALRQTYRAEKQRLLAEKRFTEVRRIANDFVFKYTDAITNLPNSSQVRAMLLQDASVYLDDLASDSEGDYELQRELATAYQRLADIQGKPHSASIGDTKGALESYEKAIALSENVYRNSTQKDEIIESAIRLLNLYSQIATTFARAADNVEKRSEYVKKRHSLIGELNKKFPENFRFKLEAIKLEFSKAAALMQSDFAQGETYFNEKILPVVAEIEENHLADPTAEKLVSRVYNELGWRYSERGKLLIELNGDRAEAISLFEKGLNFSRRETAVGEHHYKTAAHGVEEKRGIGVFYINLGIALRNLQKFDESLEYLKKGYEIKRELAEFDRSNVQAIFDMGTIFSELGLWHFEQGDYRAAIAEFEKSLAQFDRVIMADENHHEAIYYKIDVLTQLAEAHAGAGNLAKSLEIIRQAEDFSSAKKADSVDGQIQFARIFLHRGRILNSHAEKHAAFSMREKACGEFEKSLDKLKKINSGETAIHLRIVEKHLTTCGKVSV